MSLMKLHGLSRLEDNVNDSNFSAFKLQVFYFIVSNAMYFWKRVCLILSVAPCVEKPQISQTPRTNLGECCNMVQTVVLMFSEQYLQLDFTSRLKSLIYCLFKLCCQEDVRKKWTHSQFTPCRCFDVLMSCVLVS